MANVSEDDLRTDLRRAGMLGRVEIVPSRGGFRVRPHVFTAGQAAPIRAYLTKVAATYGNVVVGKGFAPARLDRVG